MNIRKNAKDRLRAARTALVLDHPFFGRLALGMDIQEERLGRTRTMGTNGRGVFYDRKFVDECSDADLIGLFAHEVMHPAMLHHTRRGDRQVGLWNDAADYAINLILQDAGFQLPHGPLIDPQYRGMTAEQIYDALKQSSAEDDQNGEQQDSGGMGSGQQGGAGVAFGREFLQALQADRFQVARHLGDESAHGGRLVRAVLGQPPCRLGAAQALLSARHVISTVSP